MYFCSDSTTFCVAKPFSLTVRSTSVVKLSYHSIRIFLKTSKRMVIPMETSETFEMPRKLLGDVASFLMRLGSAIFFVQIEKIWNTKNIAPFGRPSLHLMSKIRSVFFQKDCVLLKLRSVFCQKYVQCWQKRTVTSQNALLEITVLKLR